MVWKRKSDDTKSHGFNLTTRSIPAIATERVIPGIPMLSIWWRDKPYFGAYLDAIGLSLVEVLETTVGWLSNYVRAS